MNVATRLQQFHLEDLDHDRLLDARAVALDRTAAFYAAEGFDPTGEHLRSAASRWRTVNRPDRATFLEGLANDLVAALVRASIGAGSSVDDIARLLVNDLHLGPSTAVRALRDGAGIGLEAAKDAIHPNLPEPVRAAAERVWDELEAAFTNEQQPPTSEP